MYRAASKNYQTGAVTIITAVLMLLVMSLIMAYSSRVGIVEQRSAANDYRAKQAFAMAESGLDRAVEFFSAVGVNQLAKRDNNGWLDTSGTDLRWQACAANDDSLPCGAVDSGGAGMDRAQVYRYQVNSSTELPVDDFPGVAQGSSANYTIQALLCIVDVDADNPANSSCNLNSTSDRFVLKLIATGLSDDGVGSATVQQVLGTFSTADGTAPAPLVSASNIHSNGNVSIVANPNGGGLGVPVSIWSGETIDFVNSNGNASSCEAEEFYNSATNAWTIETLSDGSTMTRCLRCNCPDKLEDGALSYRGGPDERQWIDVVDEDPNFPSTDELFESFFGVPRGSYELVRSNADEVYPDCSALDASSSGLIWIDGACSLSGRQIASAENPVTLVIASGQVSARANTEFFGLLYISDVMNPGVQDIRLNGSPVFYGAIITEPTFKNFNGSFTLVYSDEVLGRRPRQQFLGAVPGGWIDYL